MKGSCLCGSVTYEIDEPLKLMQYCHCSRCRKVTGSAHAANLYIAPEQFRWLRGEEQVKYYPLPDTKYFATSFCRECGANLPWLNQQGSAVIVPVGTLDDPIALRPENNIHWDSKADWYVETGQMKKFATLPGKGPERSE